VDHEFGRGVVELIRPHRPHYRDIIGHFGEMRDGFAEPTSGLAVLGEAIGRAEHFRTAANEGELLARDE
jgi:hypothetical protein